MKFTENHGGKAVIRDKMLLPKAMERLYALENLQVTPELICDDYCKFVTLYHGEDADELQSICNHCALSELMQILENIRS